jgi:dihydrolipoamide dehydrogenase
MRALDLGKRVLLVERDRIGGAGLHAGALSSKTMWHLSNDYAVACRTDRGYVAQHIELSYARVMESVQCAVAERHSILSHQIEQLVTPRQGKDPLLWFRRGSGRFLSPHRVAVTDSAGVVEYFEADHFLIATGSKPRLPEGIAVDGQRIVTSDQIEQLSDFPRSMVIVGAGVVGCEYATIFANFQQTKIHIIDQQPRILPFEDEDVAQVIASQFESMGITIHRASKLSRMRVIDDQVEYVLCSEDGVCEPIRVERALISIGRTPNTADLDLAAAGVAMAKSGGVVVEQTRSTTAPHIYAAGDTTTDIALVNVAELEGRHAVERMFGLDPEPLRYEALSSIMFLAPELATVGLNEQQARKLGIRYRVAVLQNRLVHRAIAMRATAGFVKLLCAPDSGKILGLRVIGPQASSTAQGIAFLIDRGGTLSDIDHCIHPHPAIPEAVQECARVLLGRSVHRTDVFGTDLIRCEEG